VTRARRETLVRELLLVAMAVTVLVPFASILLAALQPPGATVTGLELPDRLYLGNFGDAWSVAGFGRLTASSLIVAAGVVPLSLVLATLAGYGLAVLHPPGGNALMWLFLFGLTLPIEAIVIPLYFDLRSFGLTSTYWGLIVAEIGLLMPFGVFWMRTHFDDAPRSLIDAARVDGASSLMILRRILLPLAWPAIKTLGALYFMWSWNQFLLVLILIQDPDKRTAPAGLGFFVGQHMTDIPMLCAGTLIVITPILIVYLAFQRSFLRGMLAGAVKG
jgi:ABC-type glycerol-3-phosphate transport system permease component